MNDLGNACSGFAPEQLHELQEIVSQYRYSKGFIVNLSSMVGKKTEGWFEKAPDDWQSRLDGLIETALHTSYDLALQTQSDDDSQSLVNRALGWAQGERWHSLASAVSGALGGLGGISTTLVEIPVTTTLALRSIQQVAGSYGEDVSKEEIRAQCIAVLSLGGPIEEDDETETALFATRLAVNHTTVAQAIKIVLPRFGIVLSEKLLAQAVPIIGAVAGATINSVFVSYYQTMAHVHFRLRKLEKSHDADQVLACFNRILEAQRNETPVARKIKRAAR